MEKYVCTVCGYVYDPEKGDPEGGISPGTPFEELPEDWDPQSDQRLTVWEITQHLIRTMKKEGEPVAAELLAKVGGLGEAARELAYRLYNICERKGWAKEAQDYNALIISWPELEKQVEELRNKIPKQGDLNI